MAEEQPYKNLPVGFKKFQDGFLAALTDYLHEIDRWAMQGHDRGERLAKDFNYDLVHERQERGRRSIETFFPRLLEALPQGRTEGEGVPEPPMLDAPPGFKMMRRRMLGLLGDHQSSVTAWMEEARTVGEQGLDVMHRREEAGRYLCEQALKLSLDAMRAWREDGEKQRRIGKKFWGWANAVKENDDFVLHRVINERDDAARRHNVAEIARQIDEEAEVDFLFTMLNDMRLKLLKEYRYSLIKEHRR